MSWYVATYSDKKGVSGVHVHHESSLYAMMSLQPDPPGEPSITSLSIGGSPVSSLWECRTLRAALTAAREIVEGRVAPDCEEIAVECAGIASLVGREGQWPASRNRG